MHGKCVTREAYIGSLRGSVYPIINEIISSYLKLTDVSCSGNSTSTCGSSTEGTCSSIPQ